MKWGEIMPEVKLSDHGEKIKEVTEVLGLGFGNL